MQRPVAVLATMVFACGVSGATAGQTPRAAGLVPSVRAAIAKQQQNATSKSFFIVMCFKVEFKFVNCLLNVFFLCTSTNVFLIIFFVHF